MPKFDANCFFPAMAALSEAVGRDVDLVEVCKCPFAERIRQTGQLWRDDRPCSANQ